MFQFLEVSSFFKNNTDFFKFPDRRCSSAQFELLLRSFSYELVNSVSCSVGGMDMLKIEEMEKMLKEAQLEKARLIESRVRSNFGLRGAAYLQSILADG